jgi:NarL family two-component system response regulator LiaR
MTNRELDVLRLIENGLSNSQVAKKLIVSETIVKNHVSNILSKLYLAGRVRVAVARAGHEG